MGLTAELASFVAHGQALAPGPEVLRRVRTGFVDTVGVMLAGRQEPVVGILRRVIESRGAGSAQSSILLGPQRCASADAALINATAAHALDYDDVGLQGHPSAVLVPALLAEGERLHSPGLALVKAYVVGYETWAELIDRDRDLHHEKGWHPTGVFGTVAAAAAVACLRGMAAGPCAHALGLAASMAAGLVANFGSMAKPFHAGRAAANGIEAAGLAAAGMTAAGDALEHGSGLLAALSPRGRVDLSTPATLLGRRLLAKGLTVKKYPICFAAHRVVDACLDLVAQHDLRPDQVSAISVTVGRAQANMLRHHRPADSLQAKFSLEFAVAAALLARRVGLEELRDDFVQRPDLRAWFERVSIDVADTVCESEPTLAASDRLVLETFDGRRLDSGEVTQARGSASRPLTDGELRAKFMDCSAGIPDREALFDRLGRLDGLDDIVSLQSKTERRPGP